MNEHIGTYLIQCVAPEGVTLEQYGNFRMEQEDAIDLLDQDLPDSIRFSQFAAAEVACTDLGFELAQLIDSGKLKVLLRVGPMESGEQP